MPYPLRCQPFFQDYLWGGRNLVTRLNKQLPADGVWAESWEIIDHDHHQSVVVNGSKAGMTLREIAKQTPEWLLGPGNGPGDRSLPLLLKYLDCQNMLSVQVHPDDNFAKGMSPPDLGKTEAWYIVDAQPGATLYAGLKHGVTRYDLKTALQSGEVESLLHAIHPKPGDCIFIPAGTVHALGAGLLVAEIQQASNTTFRLFDWNRVGPDGKPRELHIDKALEVIDYESGPRPIQIPQLTNQEGRRRLVACEKFNLDLLAQVDLLTIADDSTFHILTTPTGGVELVGDNFHEELRIGESVLLPAALDRCIAKLSAKAVLLDMYLPRGAHASRSS